MNWTSLVPDWAGPKLSQLGAQGVKWAGDWWKPPVIFGWWLLPARTSWNLPGPALHASPGLPHTIGMLDPTGSALLPYWQPQHARSSICTHKSCICPMQLWPHAFTRAGQPQIPTFFPIQVVILAAYSATHQVQTPATNCSCSPGMC